MLYLRKHQGLMRGCFMSIETSYENIHRSAKT
jgi:hypothetical protein